MKIKVVMDSGGLMNKQEANQFGIDYLPLQVRINDQSYLDGVDLDRNFLYDQMEKGAKVQTSLPPLGLVDELFQAYKNTGVTDVLLITLSNALSSTNEKVQWLGKELGLHMHTLDIYSTLGMEKYMAIYAKRMVDEGMEPETIIARLQESVDRSCGYLIVEDLDHLAKGGRLTPMAAKLGGMLKIKPILRVSKDTQGRVDLYDKVRTMKRAIKEACEIISRDPQLNAEDYQVVIMDSRAQGYAQYAQDMLELLVPGIEIERDDLCPVINCHTGMGSVGIQYIYRR
ncbi:MAG: DegV family protein [Absicoccus sp.]|uniref:DegV family protein n=1 Tax=Absicoccus intestinalis TaxID=2926319 RepID=A0ABU4WP69_9FIRM|nr:MULTISPECIES: DegV family protein [unclassified Absicoccus]MDX8418357.1 DegV family protein [Absicoccus sp. CLA-KB-P134]MDY3034919.1 DegV family protein [Absicoccus sp.]